jgi:hypothetical protein
MRPAEMTPLSVTMRTLLIPLDLTSVPMVFTDPGPMTIRGVVLNTLTIAISSFVSKALMAYIFLL